MNLQSLKTQLRKYIANNQLAKFFTCWEAEVREDAEIGDLFILKKGQWKELERNSIMGVLSSSDESQKRAVLLNGLLSMIGNLEEQDLLKAKTTAMATSSSSSSANGNEVLIKLLQDKIEYLRRRHIIESGASVKYQLTQEIAEAEAELKRLLNT